MSVDVNIIQRPEDLELSFHAKAALGRIPGVKTVNKFGRNIEIDSTVTADIWDGGFTVASGGVSLIWVAPTASRTHTIASTDVNDTAGGTGAREVRIFGLQSWDSAETSEDVVMNTGSPPVTQKSYVIIHRMLVLAKGSADVNIGTITATATTDATITAQIRPSQGQTQMAIYGIPSGQIALMDHLYASTNKAVGTSGLADMSLEYNPEPQAELTNFLVKHTFGLQTVGTSAYLHDFLTPKVFSGPGIIKVQAVSGTDNMDVSAGFDLLLVDKD